MPSLRFNHMELTLPLGELELDALLEKCRKWKEPGTKPEKQWRFG